MAKCNGVNVMPSWSRSWLHMVGLLLCLVGKTWSESVYMDRYGDCFHEGPIEVEEEAIVIHAQGGEAYDTLNCEMTFKSILNDRLCLSFRQLKIDKCDVKLWAFSEDAFAGDALGSYGCHTDELPDTVCSEGRYMSVVMKKQQLSHQGYNFKLELRQYTQSDAFAHGIDSFIVSISVIIGIVVGVIVLVVLTAVVSVCCCCKNKQFGASRQKSFTSAYRSTAMTEVPVLEPSAPPLMEDQPPAYSDSPPPYTPTTEDTTNNVITPSNNIASTNLCTDEKAFV